MEKMTFSQKIENFWYHNKYTVIVASVFIIFLAVSLTQMFSKKSHDANLLYIGTASISFSHQGKLQESAGVFMKDDYNSDGKKSINYKELTVLDPMKAQDFDKTPYTSHQIDSVAGEQFTAELIAGESMIYLADETYYNIAKEQNILMPLSEALGKTPDFAIDEYAVYLKDLDIFYLSGFNKLPSDTIVFVRYPVSITQNKKEIEKHEKSNLNVFGDMFEYVHPNKPEDKVKAAKRMTREEFLDFYEGWCEKQEIEFLRDYTYFEEISTDEIFEKTGATVYKCDSKTFLAFDGETYSIGRNSSADGVSDIDICDFDNNGIYDLIFTYSYYDSKWSCGVSVFNLSTLREIQLGIKQEFELAERLLLEPVSINEFEVWKTLPNDELYLTSLTNAEKTEKAFSVISQNGSVAVKTYK